MKNSTYWKLRFQQLEAAQNQKGAAAYQEIEKQYRQAQREIEGKINTWYQRFADNNGITFAEARQYLKSANLKEFQWDVWDYIRYGQENAINQNWMKELENASAKYHISKLEALKIQTQQSLEVMFSKQMGITMNTMKDVFQTGYYHTAFEIQTGFHIGWDIAGLDQRQIEKVISKPWAVDGKNFSERIWGNKEKLIKELHTELTQMVMLGNKPQKAMHSITKKMNTSKQNAGRLVMTEAAYFSSAAQKDCFEDLGVEQYEIVATLDSHTSKICQNLDGKHFPMKDYEAGVTAPPFHVYCRSTTAPYFEEDFGDIGERAAREEETGKTYYIPNNMNYQEWKQTFVCSGNKSEFKGYKQNEMMHWTKEVKSGKIKSEINLGELATAYGKKHQEAISKFLLNAPKEIQNIWNDCADDFHCLEPRYRGKKTFYSPSMDGVKLNISFAARGSEYQTPYQVMFHEYGHHIDYILNRKYGDANRMKTFSEIYKDGLFGKTLKEEAREAIKTFAKRKNLFVKDYETSKEKVIEVIDWEKAEQEFCEYIKKELTLIQRADISDMFEPVMSEQCSYPFGVGHGIDYWEKRDNGKEGFAEMYSATVNNPKSLEQIKRFFPKSYKIFLEILEVIP